MTGSLFPIGAPERGWKDWDAGTAKNQILNHVVYIGAERLFSSGFHKVLIMLSFRRKILLSDIVLFLVFIAFLFPFVEKTVGNIMSKSLENRARQFISLLETAPDFSSMLSILETEEEFIFQRISLISAEGKLLYDSHLPSLKKARGYFYEEPHPEIEQALETGAGYSEGYTVEPHEAFAYVALSFEAHEQKYILRTGFPYHEIRKLTIDFEVGFLLLGSFILMLYSVMTWAIIHRLSRPIQQIIDAILPYQEGREEYLPAISLGQMIPGDEFNKLAFTLNSLTMRIQKQIENLMQQRKETEGILESLSEGIVAVDASGRVTFANQVGCRMLGVTHQEMIGRTLDQIQGWGGELSKKCHELVLQALQTSEPTAQTWALQEKGKTYLRLVAAPLARQSGAILVLQDKTSDYKIVEMGKDFIANASHELRTPITIIRGFAETLQDLKNPSKELLHDITEKIVRTSGRLDKLVKSLLTLADIENVSEQSFRTADIVSLAEHCKHLLLAAHPQAKVSLVSELPKALVKADSDLVDLAIMNLLENSVKYSSNPAQIEIEIRQHDKEVALNVKDKGIGIPEGDLPHIFNRFYTVDKARSRKSGGAGLGLSIVKTIVEKHSGRVGVSSQLGQGSMFSLYFPLKSSGEEKK